jgi:hypothetical protein
MQPINSKNGAWLTAYKRQSVRAFAKPVRRLQNTKPLLFGERHLRHVLLSYMDYHNAARTHLSLCKDAPVHRRIQRFGTIEAQPVLGGLHHQYVRKVLRWGQECIGKGKAAAPYEFGVKASIVTNNRRAPGGLFVLHARALSSFPRAYLGPGSIGHS